jgi:hypothetical protein
MKSSFHSLIPFLPSSSTADSRDSLSSQFNSSASKLLCWQGWRLKTQPTQMSESESQLLYDWWFTANQFVLEPSLLRLMTSNFFNLTPAVIVLIYHPLWREEGSVIYNFAAGPRQRSHSRVPVLRSSWSYPTVSVSRLPQPGEPGPRIYIPRNRVAQLYPHALGSLFVVSYDSQGYGGDIRTCLHTGFFSVCL